MKRRHLAAESLSIRETNLSIVLRALQETSSLSRAGLALSTGLNKTTISSLVDELLGQRWIQEIGLDSSGSGRPAMLLGLKPEAGCIIGLEIGVDFVSAIVTDFTGKIIWRNLLETDPSTPQAIIMNRALGLIDQARTVAPTVLGIGLTVPGMVDVAQGLLLFSPNLQWRQVALQQIFEEHTNLPVYVDNDANAAALGEHFFGKARQIENFIFLTLGIGIGGGLFLDGSLYRGAGGLAGEIGHTNLMGDRGRPCRCGNRGCWETTGNQYALMERVQALLEAGRNSLISAMLAEPGFQPTLAMIATAAGASDPVALEALAETGRAVGLGVANLINTFNPELVVIGGTMSLVDIYLLPAINQAVDQHTLAEMRQQAGVVASAFGSDANMMGGVALVVNAILGCPTRFRQVLGKNL